MSKNFYQYRAKLIRVVDGDTLDVMVDLGFDVHVKLRVRLAGIDAPEIFGKKSDLNELELGRAAARFVVDHLPSDLEIHTHKGKGKYGRWIAEVWYKDQEGVGHNIGEQLVEEGLAVRKEY